MNASLTIFSPAGVVAQPASLRRAVRRLAALGFDAHLDADAAARRQRFAGDDALRLAALHRIADAAPSIAMASRGGYGLSRLLDRLDWKRLERSVERGTRWVGYSDMTALQMGLLAHVQAPSWAGPMAAEDFGRSEEAGGLDEVTADCFREAMGGELEAVGFRTEAGFDGLAVRGRLWGGNLAMLCALLGTPHFPRIKGGVLFVEEVNEHPYRVERCLLQLQQAGVLEAQKALLIGAVTAYKPSPLDRGYGLKQAIAHLRSRTSVPILTGLPFGHVPTKVSLPIGRAVELVVQGRDALVAWGHTDA
jgi:muramoyltetrapeptide carboxypeptidase